MKNNETKINRIAIAEAQRGLIRTCKILFQQIVNRVKNERWKQTNNIPRVYTLPLLGVGYTGQTWLTTLEGGPTLHRVRRKIKLREVKGTRGAEFTIHRPALDRLYFRINNNPQKLQLMVQNTETVGERNNPEFTTDTGVCFWWPTATPAPPTLVLSPMPRSEKLYGVVSNSEYDSATHCSFAEEKHTIHGSCSEYN